MSLITTIEEMQELQDRIPVPTKIGEKWKDEITGMRLKSKLVDMEEGPTVCWLIDNAEVAL